jgi:hypothetical protein
LRSRLAPVILLSLGAACAPASPEPARADADPQAERIAEAVLERLGGRAAWDRTRYLRWRFFGGRLHYWDRRTGDVRIESPAREIDGGGAQPELLVLMNVNTRTGRAWENGAEVTDAARLAEYLDLGHQWWVNDSYWMFMPYKLLDPGVNLAWIGERALPDGRAADVLELTFDAGVGYTPENRYEVWVARDTGLVEQWSFWSDAADADARFTLPWSGWSRFGDIWLARNHGRDMDWEIAVSEELPASVFREPSAVAP